MNNAIQVGTQWLDATLRAGTALSAIIGSANVWNSTAPNTTTDLYASFVFNGGKYDMGVGGILYMSEAVFAVSVTGRVDSHAGAVYQAASAILGILHKASGTVASGTVLACTVENPLFTNFNDRGVEYIRVGDYYRIEAQ